MQQDYIQQQDNSWRPRETVTPILGSPDDSTLQLKILKLLREGGIPVQAITPGDNNPGERTTATAPPLDAIGATFRPTEQARNLVGRSDQGVFQSAYDSSGRFLAPGPAGGTALARPTFDSGSSGSKALAGGSPPGSSSPRVLTGNDYGPSGSRALAGGSPPGSNSSRVPTGTDYGSSGPRALAGGSPLGSSSPKVLAVDRANGGARRGDDDGHPGSVSQSYYESALATIQTPARGAWILHHA